MRSIPVLIIALLGAAIVAPRSIAQMRASTMSMPGAVASSGFGRSVGVSFTGRPHFRSFGPNAIFLADPFYANYSVEPLAIPAAPPQVVIVEPANSADTPPEPRPELLLIELQGNRYVRFGGRQQSAEPATNAPPDYAEPEAHSSPPLTRQMAQPEPAPAILIFRDGHREQTPEYAIVGSTLYTKGDYWRSGQWTKTIQLSALDVPATIQANHDAGIKFTLPSAPNEVVTRP